MGINRIRNRREIEVQVAKKGPNRAFSLEIWDGSEIGVFSIGAKIYLAGAKIIGICFARNRDRSENKSRKGGSDRSEITWDLFRSK